MPVDELDRVLALAEQVLLTDRDLPDGNSESETPPRPPLPTYTAVSSHQCEVAPVVLQRYIVTELTV